MEEKNKTDGTSTHLLEYTESVKQRLLEANSIVNETDKILAERCMFLIIPLIHKNEFFEAKEVTRTLYDGVREISSSFKGINEFINKHIKNSKI